MSAPRFTPGPWVVSRLAPQEWSIDAPSGDMRIGHSVWESLAIVYGNDDLPNVGKEVGASNASLIAAAPDLFHALRDVIGWVSGPEKFFTDEPAKAVDRARAALAKAVQS